ncbi:hypothetical protein CYMTET_28623 [Cymbomonas tetramitiformis]|uniref:Uncharacterized protein n=1 Tax=Cymbomonas tetramitiformis TaxID=36881 RepID=A0AAE0FMJ8_9CHLO|nr:hypothetical protein CYMTET_28623 [Cymbomonas tetramitiformis]
MLLHAQLAAEARRLLTKNRRQLRMAKRRWQRLRRQQQISQAASDVAASPRETPYVEALDEGVNYPASSSSCDGLAASRDSASDVAASSREKPYDEALDEGMDYSASSSSCDGLAAAAAVALPAEGPSDGASDDDAFWARVDSESARVSVALPAEGPLRMERWMMMLSGLALIVKARAQRWHYLQKDLQMDVAILVIVSELSGFCIRVERVLRCGRGLTYR